VAIRTRLCDLLGITHPIVLGGMAGATTPELVAAVSNAGGVGIQGCSYLSPAEVERLVGEIRRRTDRPFGLNVLVFSADAALWEAVIAARPAVLSTAWAYPQQSLKEIFDRAHAAGSRVMHMVSTVDEAGRAVDAGADLIVAQGSEGGGHVGVMGTMPLVRMVVRAVAPVPVVAAGGVADGAGLAAALMLGAEGILLGTRFLATTESPLHGNFKRAILASDGHDTLLTEIPDLISGRVWPGAYVRVARNGLIRAWIGREGELRRRRAEVAAAVGAARRAGDVEGSSLLIGQTAGLIDDIVPAAAVVERTAREAEELLRSRAAGLLT
jgi:NAD(P)H-dependent flavin oxidoreductase YrpB (nitropropane dioxygenase family)